MNWIDLIIAITILGFMAEGLRRGFFLQIIDIGGFLISLIFSLNFYPQAAQILAKLTTFPKIAANPISFLLLWLITETIYFGIISFFSKPILTKGHYLKANKILGIFPSIANALLFLSFLFLFVVSLPINPQIKKEVFDSKFASFLVAGASVLEKPFNSIFGPIAKQSLTFLTVRPEEKGSIPLEFTQSELTIDGESERRMLELVNSQRVKFGVRSLNWDERLAEVGRRHSKDMFERGYFSHFSPEGENVGNRLEVAGIQYNIAGENLALAPDIIRAHDGLMNSPGHRRNILDPAFGKIGIGVIDGGIYGKMTTQVFTN